MHARVSASWQLRAGSSKVALVTSSLTPVISYPLTGWLRVAHVVEAGFQETEKTSVSPLETLCQDAHTLCLVL